MATQTEAKETELIGPTPPMPTKAQWEKVKLELGSIFGNVVMEVDGLRVTWEVRQEKALKYLIVPFIDGKHAYSQFNPPKFGDDPSEEIKRNRRLLCRKTQRNLLNEKELALFKKFKNRAEFKAIQERNTYTQYHPLWASPTSLIAHLKREAKTIVIKRIGYASQD